MSDQAKDLCPDCQDAPDQTVDRRGFFRKVEQTSFALVAGGLTASAAPALAQQTREVAPLPVQARPAENLIRELFTSLTAEQKERVVQPFDHGGASPTRHRTFNRAMNATISQVYTRPQTELVQRIVRAICSDEGYDKINTVIRTDNMSRGLDGAGANFFGDPTRGAFAWVLTAHHLTLRCDGDSQPGAAFGGPFYYGHSPAGDSARNAFHFQTRSVTDAFNALSEEQKRRATVSGSPGENSRFRPAGQERPGIGAADLSRDQRRLVEQVLRDLLLPFREEDADEVMEIIRQNGGLERLHLAFYRDQRANNPARWNFWRVEGPGFIWNYRVLPHVHCYVNIAQRA